MITIHNLSKSYNGVTVLNLEGFEIPRGQAFGLVGNNGAGKTTLFSCLLDLIQPTSGYIENGGVKATFEDFFNDEILGKRKYLRDLSKGNQKKVGIVATLIGNPEVIILDEPFANLDPTTQIRLKGIIKKMAADQNVTVLVSSHDLQHVTEVCERIVVLEKGNQVKDIITSPETLKELENYFSGNTSTVMEEE